MGKPVDITNFIKTSASHTNDVVLYWHQDIMYPQVLHFILVYIVMYMYVSFPAYKIKPTLRTQYTDVHNYT